MVAKNKETFQKIEFVIFLAQWAIFILTEEQAESLVQISDILHNPYRKMAQITLNVNFADYRNFS